jgi:hypothetical protein
VALWAENVSYHYQRQSNDKNAFKIHIFKKNSHICKFNFINYRICFELMQIDIPKLIISIFTPKQYHFHIIVLYYKFINKLYKKKKIIIILHSCVTH